MTPTQLIDTASRYQVYLEGLKAGHVRDFDRVFSTLNSLMRATLNELRVDKLNELPRARLEEFLAKLQVKQLELFDGEVDRLLAKMPALAEYASEFEAKAIKTVLNPKGRKFIKVPLASKVHREAMRRPIQATGTVLEVFVKDWTKLAVRQINGAIRIGYQQGHTVARIIKRLEGTPAARYNDGVHALNTRQARTVIRTGVQHVSATARQVTYETNSDVVQGVQWVSTLDGKTSATCRSLDGNVYKINEGPRPPLHPNCRSTTAPDLDPAFNFLDEGATRSSAKGYVDAELSYYDWLKMQPEGFQDSVLGVTRGALLRDGGLTAERFAALQLNKNFEPITLEQMRKLEPHAFQLAGLTK